MVAIEEGTVITGKYRLERLLARGGMGSVWMGRHLELGVAVAIKFIDSTHGTSDGARARFKREAKAAAQLKTSHVVQVYDYGVEDGTPYLVMELLEGEDLGARLAWEKRLSPAAAGAILIPVCKAVHSAHAIGLVHRDLKPANIFLSRQGDEEIVKVLDFGIAKWTDPDEHGHTTESGAILGSPHYMSPEQARSRKEVDHRSDLWSIGVIAFRALTGELPFVGNALPAIIMGICVDPIPVASRIVAGLGPEVDAFFARALARDPAQRFQSARELAEAFVSLSGPSSERSAKLASWSAIHPLPVAGSSQPATKAASSPDLSGGNSGASSAEGASTQNTLSLSEGNLPQSPVDRRRSGLFLATIAGIVALVVGLSGFAILRNASTTPAAGTIALSDPPQPSPSTTAESRSVPTVVPHASPLITEDSPSGSASDAGTRRTAGGSAQPPASSNNAKSKPAPTHMASPAATGAQLQAPAPGPSATAAASQGHGIY